jgi:hypothetical protein
VRGLAARRRQREIARRQPDAAQRHGQIRPDQPVGDPATHRWRHEHQPGGKPEQLQGQALVQPQPAGRRIGRHEQRDQPDEAVIGKALPEFGGGDQQHAARLVEEIQARRTRL